MIERFYNLIGRPGPSELSLVCKALCDGLIDENRQLWRLYEYKKSVFSHYFAVFRKEDFQETEGKRTEQRIVSQAVERMMEIEEVFYEATPKMPAAETVLIHSRWKIDGKYDEIVQSPTDSEFIIEGGVPSVFINKMLTAHTEKWEQALQFLNKYCKEHIEWFQSRRNRFPYAQSLEENHLQYWALEVVTFLEELQDIQITKREFADSKRKLIELLVYERKREKMLDDELSRYFKAMDKADIASKESEMNEKILQPLHKTSS